MNPLLLSAAVCTLTAAVALGAERVAATEVHAAMRKAAELFRTKAASHGGYVYYYTPDLSQRWGEGAASVDQIWV